MAKLPEKIEDWTPPWEKNGEEFDAEKATTLIFALEKKSEKANADKAAALAEKRDVETKLAAAEQKVKAKPAEESAKDSKIDELTTELTALKADGRAEDRKLIQKYEVALTVGGLGLRDAKRLQGEDIDELTEDATDLASRFSGGSKDDEANGKNQQSSGSAPPRREPIPRGELGNGRTRRDEAPPVVSVEDMMKDTSTGPGLVLAPLR